MSTTQRTDVPQLTHPQPSEGLFQSSSRLNILTNAVEQSSDGIAVIDIDGAVLYVNGAWCAMHGYDRGELLGRHIQIFYPDGIGDEDVLRLIDALRHTSKQEVELSHIHKDGSVFQVWVIVSLIRDENDYATGFVVTIRDVSERNRLRNELQAEKDRLEQQYRRQAALSSLELAINQPHELRAVMNRIVRAVDELLPTTGGASILLYDPETGTFATSASTVPDQEPEEATQRIRSRGGASMQIVQSCEPVVVEDTQTFTFDFNAMLAEYSLRAYAGVPVMGGDECIGVLYALDREPRQYSSHDIDFLRAMALRAGLAITKVQLYEQLQSTNALLQNQTQDLASRNEELDAFSRTVAHDLKNLLTTISGSAEVLQDDFDTLRPADRSYFLETIISRGEKMRQIIEALLLLARVRREEVALEPLQMGEIVSEALNRLEEQIDATGARIALPDVWQPACGYGPWLEEVWANYLSNALKYGGLQPEIRVGSEKISAGEVRFWVEDNGPGISPEDQSRLFVPFTQLYQGMQSGHGLGLSIVRDIISKCGGRVGVESTPGHGCKFWFSLPRTTRNCPSPGLT